MRVLCSPNTKDIEHFIIENNNSNDFILHIVPTMILQVRRRNFYRKQILNVDTNTYRKLSEREKNELFKKHNIYIYELNHLMKDFVLERKYKIISNKENLIILERLMNEMWECSHHTWTSLLKEVKELFDFITISKININTLRNFSKDESWEYLIKLYCKYKKYVKENNIMDQAMSFNRIIESDELNKFNKVYIDGSFLPITPLLHRLIEKLKELGKEIHFIIPYDLNRRNNPLFTVLEKTYSQYVSIDKWINLVKQTRNHNVVNQIANKLFENTKVPVNDRSIRINKFRSLDEEIKNILFDITAKIRAGNVQPNKIAIVTPNAMEFRPIVRETLELYSNSLLTNQNRPLIDLPLGKFLSLLYQIHIDDRIEVFGLDHFIDVALIENLLHLNIINSSEKNIRTFDLLKAFFDECQTFSSWFEQINKLKKGIKQVLDIGTYHSHPLYHIDINDLTLLKEDIKKIETLSNYLIHIKSMRISEHIDFLIGFINNKIPIVEEIKSEKCEIIEKLKGLKRFLLENENIVITSKEFGKRMLTILNDSNFLEEDGEEEDRVANILVTGPNNIEYQEYDYIYLARFTQNIYPEIPKFRWPLTKYITYQLLKHSTKLPANNMRDYSKYLLDRALFHFFIVLNSAEKGLVITYSKEYDQIEQTPSHYLYDIADVLLPNDYIENADSDKIGEKLIAGLEEMGIFNVTSGLPKQAEPYNPQPSKFIIKENTDISIEDIVIYELCPRRLYYEKNYEESNIYRSKFQLIHYASACLYEKAVRNLVEHHSRINKENVEKVIFYIDDIIAKAKSAILPIFPLSKSDWEDIENRTKGQLESLIRNIIFNNNTSYGVVLSLDGQKNKKKIGSYNFRGERDLKVTFLKNKSDYDGNVNLSNITHYYSVSNFKKLLVFNVYNKVKKKYFDLLRGFCNESEGIEKRLLNYAEKISKGKFPKKHGDHCNYCPFRGMCMNKEIVINDVDK